MIGRFAVDSGQFMFIPKGHASKFEQTLFESSRGILDEKGEKHYLWQDFMSYEAKLPGADCTVNEGVASGRYKQFQEFPALNTGRNPGLDYNTASQMTIKQGVGVLYHDDRPAAVVSRTAYGDGYYEVVERLFGGNRWALALTSEGQMMLAEEQCKLNAPDGIFVKDPCYEDERPDLVTVIDGVKPLAMVRAVRDVNSKMLMGLAIQLEG